MPNLIEQAQILQQELDKAAVGQLTSGWMELNADLVKYVGGREIKIPKLTLSGLADYSREDGFKRGAVNLSYQTKEMTQDRGRSFTFDEHDVDETNFVLTASRVIGEFQRVHVVPEIDAYRYSKIATGAIAKGRASGGYTADADTLLSTLYADIARVQDEVGDDVPLVITMSRKVATLLDTSKEIAKQINVSDFKQGDLNLKVKTLDGDYPIIRPSSSRMKTSYVFKTGEAGQEAGGFEADSEAKDINWIISTRVAPIAVSKTDKSRIFDPETYQKGRMWATDYRKYHDLWVPDNKWAGIFVNIKQAL